MDKFNFYVGIVNGFSWYPRRIKLKTDNFLYVFCASEITMG